MLAAKEIDALQEQARADVRNQLIAELIVGGAATVFRPGDKIILRVQKGLQLAEVDKLYKLCADFFGNDAKNVLILSSDIEIFALRREQED